MTKIMYPYYYYAEYTDGTSLYFKCFSEDDCICEIANEEKKHGKCTFYTGVCDEDYEAGEYVGVENFIYE